MTLFYFLFPIWNPKNHACCLSSHWARYNFCIIYYGLNKDSSFRTYKKIITHVETIPNISGLYKSSKSLFYVTYHATRYYHFMWQYSHSFVFSIKWFIVWLDYMTCTFIGIDQDKEKNKDDTSYPWSVIGKKRTKNARPKIKLK